MNGSSGAFPLRRSLLLLCGRRTSAVARLLILLLAALAASTASQAAADEGWVITGFSAEYTVRPDGSVVVVETIQVDFGSEQKHGIFRDISDRVPCVSPPPASEPRDSPCPEDKARSYGLVVTSVTGAGGRVVPSLETRVGTLFRIRIGDPDRTVSGAQTYRIAYTLLASLDGYPSHDELYWNATGTWPVPIERFELSLHLPATADIRAACFQGRYGTNEPCSARAGTGTITFASTRRLGSGEQVTIVAGWPKGLVSVPAPVLVASLKGAGGDDGLDAWDLGGASLLALASAVGLVALWWRHGRDRRYRTVYYLTKNPSEETKPLFGGTDVVVEYLPPDDLRPAQMGVILDERADPLDVTATIIDLAVRGHLHITEIPKEGRGGHRDWRLDKQEKEPAGLLPYEQKLLDALFAGGGTVELSDLKNAFAERLAEVQKLLYQDAIERRWFSRNPETTRGQWLGAGFALAALGVVLVVVGGGWAGRGLVAAPLIPAGGILAVLSRVMARRTATGSEALRRVLGFRLYITTAETRQQEFNEQQNIFARYLPHAIVFGAVTKWAKAFEGLDDVARDSTLSWYTGAGTFQALAFATGLQGFASSVSGTLSSTPGSGGSGGSGFSGGFSGGGGGGGGGGSW